MAKYLAIVDGDKDVWGATFPDFPDGFGGGASPAEAIEDATRALRQFAADMIADGEALPEPMGFDQARDWMKRERVAGGFVYVPLVLDKRRSVKANISMDAGLLEAIDAAAKERGLTRSAFLASAALDKIEGHR